MTPKRKVPLTCLLAIGGGFSAFFAAIALSGGANWHYVLLGALGGTAVISSIAYLFAEFA